MSAGGIQIAGRFSVERVLGEGGCGKVYLASDAESGRKVALKVLNQQARKIPQAFKRFCREARAQAKIDHPGVAKIYAHELEGDSPWLALEYVQGPDMERAIRDEGKLEPARAARLGAEVAGAIGEMHRHGVLHRDLKPSNLMIREADDHAVVMDLGLAALQDATVITETGQIFGTPAYLPPEVVRGEAWTTSGDVYQIGAILFEALVGRMMVPGRSISEVLKAAARGDRRPFPPGAGLPDDLRRIILRATDVDPRQRFASAQELEQALRGADLETVTEGDLGVGVSQQLAHLEDGIGGPGGARSGGWLVKLTQPGGRSRGRSKLIAGLLFLVGLGVGFVDLFFGPPPPAEVRWQVLGDALVVSFKDEGQSGLQLLVDGQPAAATLETREDRRRLAYRGLTAGRTYQAVLRWSGGELPAETLQGGEPAVRAALGLAEDRSLDVEVTRACTARWLGGGSTRFELSRGRQTLPLPRSTGRELTLEWEEEGLPYSVRWTRDEIFTRSLARLRETVEQTDWVDVLRARANSKGWKGEGFEQERKVWRPLLPWIPEIFSSGLPRSEKLWLWNTLQHWQASVAAERWMGDRPTDLKVDPGRAGAIFMGPPPWKAEGEAALRPYQEGYPKAVDETGRLFLIPTYAQNNPLVGRKSVDYAPFAFLDWPEGVPRRGTGCVTLFMNRLAHPQRLRLEVEGDPGVAALEIWGLNPDRLRQQKNQRGRFTRCFPLELGPKAGARVRVSTPELAAKVYQFSGFEKNGHVLRWRAD